MPILTNSKGITLHCDYAQPYTARIAKNLQEELSLVKILHPPYSLDLAPLNYHLFGSLKSQQDEIYSNFKRRG